MSSGNPVWGAPRMHGELLKLGVDVSHAHGREISAAAHQDPPPDLAQLFSDTVAIDMFIVRRALLHRIQIKSSDLP
jgi:hypothetical protein